VAVDRARVDVVHVRAATVVADHVLVGDLLAAIARRVLADAAGERVVSARARPGSAGGGRGRWPGARDSGCWHERNAGPLNRRFGSVPRRPARLDGRGPERHRVRRQSQRVAARAELEHGRAGVACADAGQRGRCDRARQPGPHLRRHEPRIPLPLLTPFGSSHSASEAVWTSRCRDKSATGIEPRLPG